MEEEEQGHQLEDMLATLKNQAEDMLKIFSLDSVNRSEPEQLHPLDQILLDIVPTFFNQRPNNENGTEYQFRDYIMNDSSNDDASHMSAVSTLISIARHDSPADPQND